ncbi:hypothetical protein [Flammeovirga aprica]|uniref:Uncharacterized protein n=1 Tax=Flammeovirga aprica JL-4 TaxID=694437 RepID=A0A7X9XC15_9BACT|nr:hypothetical protein [Flammeovirga aprica]NME71337.1 hypothetical protein [Flammeovirga aprica JL-4]
MRYLSTITALAFILIGCDEYECSEGSIVLKNLHNRGGEVYFNNAFVGEIAGNSSDEDRELKIKVQIKNGETTCGTLEIDRSGFFTSDYSEEVCVSVCDNEFIYAY